MYKYTDQDFDEILNKWVPALRSGNYKQTKGCLQDIKGHCCLGVACEITIPFDKQRRNSENFLVGGFPDCQPNSPKWLKYIDQDFRMIDSANISLSLFNDSREYTFNQIADLIVDFCKKVKKLQV